MDWIQLAQKRDKQTASYEQGHKEKKTAINFGFHKRWGTALLPVDLLATKGSLWSLSAAQTLRPYLMFISENVAMKAFRVVEL